MWRTTLVVLIVVAGCAGPGGPAVAMVSTVAGTGAQASQGDGGPALKGSFDDPVAVAVSARGDVAVADAGARQVRVFRPGGTITTVVSETIVDPEGLAYGPDGSLYIADPGAERVWRVR